MNKFIKLSSLILFASFTLFSCEEVDEDIHVYKGDNLAYFSGSTKSDFYVLDAPAQKHTVQIELINKVKEQRTINVAIDTISTAILGEEFTLESSTVTIEANSNVAEVVLIGNYAATSSDGASVVLKLTDGTIDAAKFNQSHTVTIYQYCKFDREEFVGTWIVKEKDYLNEDDGTQIYYETEVTLGENPNELLMSNLWDGDAASSTPVIFNDEDPNNFTIEVTPSYLYTAGTSTVVNIKEGNGSFSACAKTIDMYFSACTSSKCYDAYLEFTKK